MTGFIEDASKPAPRMRALLHTLAHGGDPYMGVTDPKGRAAIDRWNAAWEQRK